MAELKDNAANADKSKEALPFNSAFQDILLSLFSPAANAQDSNKKLNTSQIHECLLQVLPDESFTPLDCYQLLKKNNFIYCSYGEIVLWLLNEK